MVHMAQACEWQWYACKDIIWVHCSFYLELQWDSCPIVGHITVGTSSI